MPVCPAFCGQNGFDIDCVKPAPVPEIEDEEDVILNIGVETWTAPVIKIDE